MQQTEVPQRNDLDIHGAAAYVGCSIATLYRLRQDGKGPRCYRIGRKALYPVEELDRWLEERLTNGYVIRTRKAG